MTYYRGDYSRSGYYRGDPFIGGLIGGAARALGVGGLVAKAGKWAVSRITGQTVKRAAQVAGGAVAAAAGTAVVNRMVNPPAPIEIGPLGLGGGAEEMGGGGTVVEVSPSGRRIRKRWSQREQRWIAIRKINPLNPRALKRSLRRAGGFEKFAKKTMNALFTTKAGVKKRKFKRS